MIANHIVKNTYLRALQGAPKGARERARARAKIPFQRAQPRDAAEQRQREAGAAQRCRAEPVQRGRRPPLLPATAAGAGRLACASLEVLTPYSLSLPLLFVKVLFKRNTADCVSMVCKLVLVYQQQAKSKNKLNEQIRLSEAKSA